MRATGDAVAGINYSIIVLACCYWEAAMERGLSDIVQALPKPAHPIDHAMRQHLLGRIRNPGGFVGYKELFLLLTGVALPELMHLKHHWQGLDALFALRNVLAHGRAITARVELPDGTETRPEATYEGGYGKCHDYLVRSRILDSAIDPLSLEWPFLRDEVADHFWDLAFRSVAYIGESLAGNAAQAFRNAVYQPEHTMVAASLSSH